MLVNREALSCYLEILDKYNSELIKLNNTSGIYLETGNPIVQEVGSAFLNINSFNLNKHELGSSLESLVFSLKLDSTERGYLGWKLIKMLAGFPDKYVTSNIELELSKIKKITKLGSSNFTFSNYKKLDFIREYKLSIKPISTIFLPISIQRTLFYFVEEEFLEKSLLENFNDLVKEKLGSITETLITVYKYLIELTYEEWIGIAAGLIKSIKIKTEKILSYQKEPFISSFIESIKELEKELEIYTTDSVKEYLYQLDRINKVCFVNQTMLI